WNAWAATMEIATSTTAAGPFMFDAMHYPRGRHARATKRTLAQSALATGLIGSNPGSAQCARPYNPQYLSPTPGPRLGSYEVTESDSTIALVMELVEDPTLRTASGRVRFRSMRRCRPPSRSLKPLRPHT